MRQILIIALLGPLQVTLAGAPVSAFKYSKARALLAYLALKPGQAVNRPEVCALLWPDLPETAARRNLSLVLMALREALNEKGSGQTWLLVDKEAIQLNPELPIAVDAVRFNQLLDEAERHPHKSWRTCQPCADHLREALALYRDEFLAQLFVSDSAPFEEWALTWRERLRQRTFSLLERLAARAEWRGDYTSAVEYARQVAALDSLRESSQRELMRLLALAGQWTAAEGQYEQLRRMLAGEFGLAPEAETERLYAQVRGRQPDRLRLHAAPPFNGPTPPNALIGRAAELEQICERLRDPAVRAVTLTGTPGMGKTRLALEAAYGLRADFEDGVHVVELASTAEAGQVPAVVAQALGVKEQPGQALEETLRARLKRQHLLLMLDNFEHVLEAAGVVADWLAAGPNVKVLATSRVPLRIRPEQRTALQPLAAEAAAALFVARARAAGASFELAAENAGVVAALCERVDHLPLAIELIAARAHVLTPAELLEQLAQPLEALAQGARDVPDRHRTLRNAIDWSYALLSRDEQRVFRHLGVLAGGGALSAAQALLENGSPALAALEALSEAGLVQAQAIDGGTRFTPLQTLRAYALEKLAEQGELPAAQARQAEYFAGLAEQAAPELEGPEQSVWLDRLEREQPNLRAALGWSLSHNPELGLRLALALWSFWMIRGYSSEGRGWLQRLRARSEAMPALSIRRADALAAESRLAIDQGDFREAADLARQCHELSLRLEHPLGIAWALHALGHAQVELGEYEAARSHLIESLELFKSEADRPGMAASLNSLGFVATRQGDFASARASTEQALALNRGLNRPRIVAILSLNQGMTALAQGDYATAQQLTESALDLLRQLRDTNAVPTALLNLGNIFQDTGDLARARACFEEAIALGRSLGNANVSAPTSALGFVLLRLGEVRRARECFTESLQARLAAGERRGVAIALGNFAHLAQAEQRPERAARLLGAAEAIREAIGAPLQPRARQGHDQLVDAARAALGEADFAAAWREGKALTWDQAAALALHDGEA